MDLVAVLAAVTLLLLAVAIGYLLADRAARRSAWRRIAAERGRNEPGGDDGPAP